ncbi:MAG: electron transport complex subunit RsxC [Pseudomonadota bacterium]
MSAPTENLHSLPGGLRLPANKRLSNATQIIDVPVPTHLVVPLQQHSGETSLATVSVGDAVLHGSVIGEPEGAVGTYVHAPTSGSVISIEARQLPRRGEPHGICVIIESDGHDRRKTSTPPAKDRTALLAAVHAAGIVGLGGAVYPAAQKITQGLLSGIETVILNGVECESYITCDDRLMREQPTAVIRGLETLLDLTDAKRGIIAVESDKPEAWQALRDVGSRDSRVEFVQIPAIYPSGAEDQLIYLVCGQEVPSGGLPGDLGILVQNVGTSAAITALVDSGHPLTSRIVTVTGEGVERPGNYRVRFGTPIADVVAAAGGYNSNAHRLLVGGPMTGFALTDDALPVTKSCNCLLVTGPAVQLSNEPRRECIRCGECAAHCPVRLLPQSLYHYSSRHDHAVLAELGLKDCIECGCCDLVCPSHIPLTQIFRDAKHSVAVDSHAKQRALRAEDRYRAHIARAESRSAVVADAREQKKRAASADAIAAIVQRRRPKQSNDREV